MSEIFASLVQKGNYILLNNLYTIQPSMLTSSGRIYFQ